MKVEEAKTKICPFILNNDGWANKEEFFEPYANCLCITDKCMAWEWVTEALPTGKLGSFDYQTNTTDGYCKRIGQ